jgi:hypothetical protein
VDLGELIGDHRLWDAIEACRGVRITPGLLKRLGERYGEELARFASTQPGLQQSAKRKFSEAERMLFDSGALEMATHEAISAWRASQFPVGVPVTDLTCGIGGDLIAFCRRGPAVGFDLDAGYAHLAGHNLAALGLQGEVHVGNALDHLEGLEYGFIDPARRNSNGRITSIGEYLPDPRLVFGELKGAKRFAAKLSPIVPDSELRSLGKAVDFIGHENQCKEALVWTGSEVEPQPYRAVDVDTGETLTETDPPPPVTSARGMIAEAKPVAIRAHVLGHFAAEALGDTPGYLTADAIAPSPWLKRFEVLADHAADVTRTRAALRTNGGGTPVVKSRAKIDVEKLQRELSGPGYELVVLVYANGPKLRHAVCRLLKG